MDVDAVLAEVRAWPVRECVRLYEALREHLVEQGVDFELTTGRRAELDRRLAEDDSAPDDVVAWEKVETDSLARSKRFDRRRAVDGDQQRVE